MDATRADVTRAEVEDLLYEEAAALDDWRMEDWLRLLSDDATYRVITPDLHGLDPLACLSLVLDDAGRLRSRARQYLGKFMWAEVPRALTRRLITNVRIVRRDGPTVAIAANFLIHRSRPDRTDTFVGRYEHVLARTVDGLLKIRDRLTILDADGLRAQGKLSIIL